MLKPNFVLALLAVTMLAGGGCFLEAIYEFAVLDGEGLPCSRDEACPSNMVCIDEECQVGSRHKDSGLSDANSEDSSDGSTDAVVYDTNPIADASRADAARPDAWVARDAAPPDTLNATDVFAFDSAQFDAGRADTTPVDAMRVDAVETHVVAGSANGIVEPVGLRLTFSGGEEVLAVTGDGPFEFVHSFVAGDSFVVSLVGEPACVLQNAIGSVPISGVDTDSVVLTCDGVAALTDLVLSVSAQLSPAFSSNTLEYTVQVSLLVQTIFVTASVAQPEATLRVQGATAESGEPTPPSLLSLGVTTLDLVVAHPSGLSRSYRVEVTRGDGIAQQAYAKAHNPGGFDKFGTSVCLSGDTLVVGATNEDSVNTGVQAGASGGSDDTTDGRDSGAAYVFRRVGGEWVQEAYIKAHNTGTYDNFGRSIAVFDDTLVVGAYGESSADIGISVGSQGGDNDDASKSGAVYVFRRNGTMWTQEAFLKAHNADIDDYFGRSVALSQDTIAVGSYLESSDDLGISEGTAGGEDNNAIRSGAVYVFKRTGTIWAQEAYIKAHNAGAEDLFGVSLALSDDTLVVGAYKESSSSTGISAGASGGEDDSFEGAGAVYVFRRNASVWTQEAYIKADNTNLDDAFGYSVGLSGDTCVVGANKQGTNGAETGAVYVFLREGTTWTQEAFLQGHNVANGDSFGYEVAIAGEILAVSARDESSAVTGVFSGAQGGGDDDAYKAGAVYIFRRGGAVWSQEAYIKAHNTEREDGFGHDISLSSDSLVVGAWSESSSNMGVQVGAEGGSDNGAPNSGAVYLFQ